MTDKFCVNCAYFVRNNKNPDVSYFCKKAFEKIAPERCVVTGKFNIDYMGRHNAFWQRSPSRVEGSMIRGEIACGPEGAWYVPKAAKP